MGIENLSTRSKLGIFDSGVGGFSVLKEVRGKTSVDILYFGDCARAPYGNRSGDEIILFIKEIITNLKGQDVTHFVSACNSMSVMTTDRMLKDCGIPNEHYIDMLRAFKEQSSFPEKVSMLVVGTQATITSGAYREVLEEKGIVSHDYIFRTLAGLIEQGVHEDEIYDVVKDGMLHAKELGVSHVLYGCTHYPLIDDVFKKCADDIGWNGQFIDPAVYVAKAVEAWSLEGEKQTFFEASEVTRAFRKFSGQY